MLDAILVPALLFIVMIAAFLFIPRFMVRRAMRQVIARFREHRALDPQSAKTQGELGLNPLSFVQRMASPRDYKPTAMKILMSAGIIASTPDGKMYLLEDKVKQLHSSIAGK